MLSGTHLVLIGIAAMALAFAVCKALEVVASNKRRNDGGDQRPS